MGVSCFSLVFGAFKLDLDFGAAEPQTFDRFLITALDNGGRFDAASGFRSGVPCRFSRSSSKIRPFSTQSENVVVSFVA